MTKLQTILNNYLLSRFQIISYYNKITIINTLIITLFISKCSAQKCVHVQLYATSDKITVQYEYFLNFNRNKQ